jgi:ATP phosphoribosyltransferase regulatory subunit
MIMDFKLHTPIGVNDRLPDEALVKKTVCSKIENIFLGYGYREIESPTFEYIDVFSDEKMGSISPKEMFRFFDKDGNVLALRSDMTPPVARIAATEFEGNGPIRLCYFGNSFRNSKSYQGKRCEFAQAGVELMGADGVYADAEAIAVSIKSILASGIKEFKLNIGQVGFFNAVLDETGLEKEEKNKLKNYIASRNYAEAEEFIKQKNMPENIKELFLDFPKLVGGTDILDYTRSLTKSDDALKFLDELETLYNMLIMHGVNSYVSFDLSMVNKLNYYTGIIFRGYTYGSGYSIVDGGRYDNLVKQFGKNIPAVGFGIKIDEVINVLIKNGADYSSRDVKAMVGCTALGLSSALKIADIYRKGGVKVENSLIGPDIEKNIDYMVEKNYDSLIFFNDSIHITYVRNTHKGILKTEISVSDLVFPGKESR